MCYPGLNKTFISENGADIQVQTFLNHTSETLLCVPQINNSVVEKRATRLILTSKWGCDGSSGHSTYRQNFEDKNLTDSWHHWFQFNLPCFGKMTAHALLIPAALYHFILKNKLKII